MKPGRVASDRCVAQGYGSRYDSSGPCSALSVACVVDLCKLRTRDSKPQAGKIESWMEVGNRENDM